MIADKLSLMHFAYAIITPRLHGQTQQIFIGYIISALNVQQYY